MKIRRQRGPLIFSVAMHALALGALALWKLEVPGPPGGASCGGESSGDSAAAEAGAIQFFPAPQQDQPARTARFRAAAPILTTAATPVVVLPPPAVETRVPAATSALMALPPAPTLASLPGGDFNTGKGRKGAEAGKKGTGKGSGAAGGKGHGTGTGAGNSSVAYRKRAELEYPRSARKLKQEGTVRLKVHVDAAGRAAEVEIISSSGFAALDAAAVACARNSLYHPAMSAGRAIAAWVDASFRFKS